MVGSSLVPLPDLSRTGRGGLGSITGSAIDVVGVDADQYIDDVGVHWRDDPPSLGVKPIRFGARITAQPDRNWR